MLEVITGIARAAFAIYVMITSDMLGLERCDGDWTTPDFSGKCLLVIFYHMSILPATSYCS